MNSINSKAKIIVVHPTPADLRSLTGLLKEQGYEVQGATEGVSALSRISCYDPDLILLHNALPDMDSYTLCTRLRGDQQTGDVPVIFIYGLDQVAGRGRAFEAGGVDYILTPFQPVEVLARIEAQLTLRQLLEQQQLWPAENNPELPEPQGEPNGSVKNGSLTSHTSPPTNGAACSFNKGIGLPSSLRILVAEDNPTNQKLALRMLDRLGYCADVAGDGRDVLESLARQPYDVIFMDVQMPEMDGLEATRQIRRRWPEGPRIIALTAEVAAEEREACLTAGADDFIAKPMRLEDLVAALQKCQPGTPPPNPPSYDTLNPSIQYATLRQAQDVAQDAGVITGVSNPPHEVASPGVLEPKALAKLQAMVGGQNGLVVALIESTLQDAPQLLGQLRQALEKEDIKALKLAAHTLKSLANNFGATTLATTCKELESLGKAGTLEGAAERVAQAETGYEQVKSALETIRTTYQS